MTRKLTNAVMVTLVQIVKDQSAIHMVNVTMGFVKTSKNSSLEVQEKMIN